MILPEFQFLVDCAKARPWAETIRRRVHADAIDWANVLELAEQHGVRPLLRRTLKSSCWAVVPESAKVELERSYRSNAQKNLLLTAELLRVVDAFEQENIAVIPFKGPVLAEEVYGDL